MPSLSQRIGDQYQRQYGRPANADDPQYASYVQTALPSMIASDKAAYEKSKARWNTFGKIATVAGLAPFAAIAAPAMFGGGAAAGGAALPAAATQGVGVSSAGAGAAGAGMTFGNLLKLGELGTGLVTNVIGNRQQNRALDRDAALRSQEFAQQMALTQQAQEQARRQWEAEQAQRAQEYALMVEDRNRRVRFEDEREARRAPYRAMAQQALLRFGDLLRLGARR